MPSQCRAMCAKIITGIWIPARHLCQRGSLLVAQFHSCISRHSVAGDGLPPAVPWQLAPDAVDLCRFYLLGGGTGWAVGTLFPHKDCPCAVLGILHLAGFSSGRLHLARTGDDRLDAGHLLPAACPLRDNGLPSIGDGRDVADFHAAYPDFVCGGHLWSSPDCSWAEMVVGATMPRWGRNKSGLLIFCQILQDTC